MVLPTTAEGTAHSVLHSSRACYHNCWHTGSLYASSNGSHPHRLKVHSGWAPSRWTSWYVRKSKTQYSL